MASVCVDPSSMIAALSRLVAFHAELEAAASTVRQVVVPVGVPADLRGQVESTLGQAQVDLARAARSIEELLEEMRRRILAAKAADEDNTTIGVGLATAMFSTFGDLLDTTVGTTTIPKPMKAFIKTIKGTSYLGDVFGFRNTLTDPTLTTGQKITRPVTGSATSAFVAGLARARAAAAVGGTVGGPYGALAAAAAVTLWTVADGKLHVSDKIADIAAPVADGFIGGVGKAVNNIKDGFDWMRNPRIG